MLWTALDRIDNGGANHHRSILTVGRSRYHLLLINTLSRLLPMTLPTLSPRVLVLYHV